MTYESLRAIFADKEVSGEFCKWENIPPERRLHPRRADLNALLLLDQLDDREEAATRRMVNGASYDAFWVVADPETVARNATREQVIDLIRCGVSLDDASAFCFSA